MSEMKSILSKFAAAAGFGLRFFLAVAFFAVPLWAQDPEDLDEMFQRKTRLSSAAWGAQYLENPASYVWQPETLCYYDIQTGHEVWKMSQTPGLINYYHADIIASPWSADGRRLAFSSPRPTGAFDSYDPWSGRYGRIWLIVNADGSLLRPVINGPSRQDDHTLYFHWSPQIPDLYYEFGRNNAGQTGINEHDLYKGIVSDAGVSRELLLSFPSAVSSELKLDKTLSPDGRKVLAMPWDESWHYPATVYPTAQLDTLSGYPCRTLGAYGDTLIPYTSYHGIVLLGDGDWIKILLSGSHAHWRVKTVGTAPDEGALYNNDDYPVTDPDYNFGEAWPENTVTDFGGQYGDPFGCNYWSHPVADMWGRHILFSNTEVSPLGPGVWDMQRHEYVVETFGGGAQHHDWHGFTDWIVSTRGSGGDEGCTLNPDYPGCGINDRIYISRYNVGGYQETICYTHPLYNNGGCYRGPVYEYPALPRPAQSPDGTKVAWHSTFLNPMTSEYDNAPDVFWSVAYYPYPPTNLSAGSAGAGVNIEFLPPKYTERCWPYASSSPQKNSLGWPLLDGMGNELGQSLYAREIKRYHIWRSPGRNGPWEEAGIVEALYSYTYAEDPDLFMLHPTANGVAVSPSNKIIFSDNPPDGRWYYAATSEEHSGLESRELSEILQVDLSAGGLAGANVVAPKGQKDFWTTPPPEPSDFSCQAGDAPGHYCLVWTEPNDSKIRHYNIYYSASNIPPVDQQHRIASVPAGTSSYLDWCAQAGGSAYYRITSVDRYGNESDMPAPPASAADVNGDGAVDIRDVQTCVNDSNLDMSALQMIIDAILEKE